MSLFRKKHPETGTKFRNVRKKEKISVFDFRYERKDGSGHWRAIAVPVPATKSEEDDLATAREIAERRLNEQYGLNGNGEPPYHKGEPRPDLLHDLYELKSEKRIR